MSESSRTIIIRKIGPNSYFVPAVLSMEQVWSCADQDFDDEDGGFLFVHFINEAKARKFAETNPWIGGRVEVVIVDATVADLSRRMRTC